MGRVQKVEALAGYADEDACVSGLRSEIHAYLAGAGEPRRGDRQIRARSITIMLAWVAVYGYLLFGAGGAIEVASLGILGGLLSAALIVAGHNAMHGMLGDSPLLSRLLAVFLGVHGFDTYWWHIKHHHLHHRFPNVYGTDDDLEHSGLIRLSPEAPRRWWHRYQHVYAWGFYPLTHLGMVLVGDPRFLVTRTLSGRRFPRRGIRQVALWFGGKAVAATVLLVLPASLHGWTIVLPVFLAWSLTAGLVLSVLFVCTHTVVGTRYPRVGEDGRVSRGRVYMGVVGSADVGIDNPVINWLFAGVTAHTAHHLYPGVSATHYPAIARIVRRFCTMHDIPYTGFSGFGAALVAHYRYLKLLGLPADVSSREICPA